jgi:ornithine cyclodeaminase/alanine dehydrogenase-like protein (mu-crystallin family)
MHTFNHAQTLALLPFEPLVAQVQAVLAAARAGTAHCPVRTAVPLPGDATLLAMPAADADFAVVKVVTVHPANPARGLPMVGAQVLLMDARTGAHLAAFDGEALTAQRTAAVSVAAVRRMRPGPHPQLLIVGAGVQAKVHALAFAQCLGVQSIAIASRTEERKNALVKLLREHGLTVLAAADLPSAVARADLIVTATSSATPVLPDQVREGAMVCAVGAFKSSMAELPPSLIGRAHLVADTRAGCQAEAGDLLQAGVDWSHVIELKDAQPLAATRPAVFKSVGSALWDLAAARCAWLQLNPQT